MAKKENSKPYLVEIQKGPIKMETQFTEKFYHGYERTVQDMENLKLRQEKMTLTLHKPKQ